MVRLLPVTVFAVSFLPHIAHADIQVCRSALESISEGNLGRGITVCVNREIDGQAYESCDKLRAQDVLPLTNGVLNFFRAFDENFADESESRLREHLSAEIISGSCTFEGEFRRQEVIFSDAESAVDVSVVNRCAFFGVSVESDFYLNWIEIPGGASVATPASDAMLFSCPPIGLAWYQGGSVFRYNPNWEIIDQVGFAAWPSNRRADPIFAEVTEDRMLSVFPGASIIARSNWITDFTISID